MANLLLFCFCCIIFFGNPNVSLANDEKTFAGWILHMFVSGQLKEFTPRGGKLVLRKYDTGSTGNQWLPVEHLGHD